MKTYIRYLSILIIAVLVLALLSSCSETADMPNEDYELSIEAVVQAQTTEDADEGNEKDSQGEGNEPNEVFINSIGGT